MSTTTTTPHNREQDRGRWLYAVLAALWIVAYLAGCASPTEAVRIRTELATDTAADLRDRAAEAEADARAKVDAQAARSYGALRDNFLGELSRAEAVTDPAARRQRIAALAAAYAEAKARVDGDVAAYARQEAARVANIRASAEAVLAVNRMADNEAKQRTDTAGGVADALLPLLEQIAEAAAKRYALTAATPAPAPVEETIQ